MLLQLELPLAELLGLQDIDLQPTFLAEAFDSLMGHLILLLQVVSRVTPILRSLKREIGGRLFVRPIHDEVCRVVALGGLGAARRRPTSLDRCGLLLMDGDRVDMLLCATELRCLVL